MSKNKTFFTLWVAVIVLLMVSMPNGYASAYLDPGSGSLIIQVVIAGLVGIAVTVKFFWNNILLMLGFKKRSNRLTDDELVQDDPIQDA